MDFESNKVFEKKKATSKRLLDTCQRFADVLADGQWLIAENREVSISRSFVETVGEKKQTETQTQTPGEAVSKEIPDEAMLRTTALFKGAKEVTFEFDNGDVAFEEFYIVTKTTAETIHHSAVPGQVLRKLADSIESSDNQVVEDDEQDDEGDMDTRYVELLSPAVLDAFLFECEYEEGYVVDHKGKLSSYYVAVRYKADGKVIDKFRYGWDDTMDEDSATAFDGEKVLEWKSANQPELDEADVSEFINSLEQIIQDVTDGGRFEILSKDMKLGKAEHYSRVLGIIGLASSGFIQIKQ